MTTNVPREEPDPGLGATLFSIFQPNSNRLRPDVLIDEVNAVLLDTCVTVQNSIRCVHAAPGPEPPPTESVDLDMQRGSSHWTGTMDQGPEHMSELSPHNHKNHFIMGAVDPGAGQPVIEDGGSIRVLTTLSKRGQTWVALLIVFVLSLVVVPGLVLGVVIKQLSWGIALCGLIATVISFFASLYCHFDK